MGYSRTHCVLCFRNNKCHLVNTFIWISACTEYPPRDGQEATWCLSQVSSHVQTPWAFLLLRPKSDQTPKQKQNEEYILALHIYLFLLVQFLQIFPFYQFKGFIMWQGKISKKSNPLPFIVAHKQSTNTHCETQKHEWSLHRVKLFPLLFCALRKSLRTASGFDTA